MSEDKYTTGEEVILARELRKDFGDFHAVDGISFEVKRGEIFGFLGANGAGKTTAMRMLTGLSKPTSGQGRVAGYDITREAEQVKKHIGYMSQRFSLYEDLRVWENLRLYGGIYGMSPQLIRERTEQLLRSLDFEARRDTFVRDLPLGWRQKLAFSVAVFHEPEGGVDPVTRRQFWELIYAASQRGITVFVTTHYMDEAEYCDRVSIMVDGRIQALDSPRGLREAYGVSSMEEVFQRLARGATRSDS